MPNIENILKHVRKGSLEKVKPLVSQYSPEQLGQALRAAIVHNHHSCVAFLVPYVAVSQSVDAYNLTVLEHAFWTSIVHKKNKDFDCIFKHVDVTKNDSVFLYMACQSENLYAASHLVPFSNIEVVWEKMENQKLNKECFDIIRQDYEAFQQNQLLNSMVERKSGFTQRKL